MHIIPLDAVKVMNRVGRCITFLVLFAVFLSLFTVLVAWDHGLITQESISLPSLVEAIGIEMNRKFGNTIGGLAVFAFILSFLITSALYSREMSNEDDVYRRRKNTSSE